ncbi:MAG TPA: hypothetical protein VLW52_00595 [Opitutaceae bacterium]|nr:hypothetical protein [Opitutaceae bacterium]
MALAQQVPDLEYRPPLPRPAYELGKGPRVAIDEAHHNYHTATGRYEPFAALLRRDGYRVDGLAMPFSPESLSGVDVLVIANALNGRNIRDWSLPTPSAFTTEEITAVRAWVEKGGALFLIVDHMPFPGAAGDLAKAFGIEFSNGFAVAKRAGGPTAFTFRLGTGLEESAITQGRGNDERVSEVVTFTGSAFKPPQSAIPVLRLSGDYESLETKRAWQFTAATPREPLKGWCQGAIMKIGEGRLAVFGEAAMFSAQLAGPTREKTGMNAPLAKQNHQLLLNLMHWLTRASGMPE